jgi:hypothetical protein
VGLVATPDYVLGELKLSLFVNNRRLGPVILNKVNHAKLPAPLDEWFKDNMTEKQPGLLQRDGTAGMDKVFLASIKKIWTTPAPTDSLKIEGGHTAELILDNRDGSMLAIASAIASAKGIDFANTMGEGRIGVAKDIVSVRVQADIQPDDSLHLLLTIECTPGSENGMAKVLGMGLDMGFNQVQMMAKLKGLTVTGKSSIEGKIVKGEYNIADITSLL